MTTTEAETTSASGDCEEEPQAEMEEDGVYLKFVSIGPLFIRVDWEVCANPISTVLTQTQPKRVTYSKLFQGELSELIGLVYLNEATISLNSVSVRGIKGFSRLAANLGEQYLVQVKTTQVPSILSGIPGVRPVSTVVSAGVNIVREPALQYPNVLQGVRDGVSRGVQVKVSAWYYKAHFAQTTAVEFCNVGASLAFAVQSAFEVAQGVLSRYDDARDEERSRFARQPADAAAGFLQARHLLLESFKDAYKDIADRPYRQVCATAAVDTRC